MDTTVEDFADEVKNQKSRRANRFNQKKRHNANGGAGAYMNGLYKNLDPRIGTMPDGYGGMFYYTYDGPDLVKGSRNEIERYLGIC